MLPTILLLIAAANPAGAQVTARASARVIAGERIDLAAPVRQPDRQLTLAVRPVGPSAEPVALRLVEFQ